MVEQAGDGLPARGRIEAVLDAAKAAGHRDGPNPAAWCGHLALLLPRPQKLRRGHHAAMPYADVPAFIGKLRLVRGVGAFALEFAILTAARSGEVRGATWREIDMANRLWTIPASRMKASCEHRVPLSDRAIEIVKTVAPLRPEGDDGSALVIPGTRRGSPLSDMTLAAAMRRHGAGEFTAHGFRSSFRDWCSDAIAFPRELAEQALAHAYRQRGGSRLQALRRPEKRRALMTAWARYLDGADGNVVSLDAAWRAAE